MAIQIQLRNDTAANWTSNNPTLAAGEMGVESDTSKLKVGDGTTAWTSLDYYGGVSDHGALTGLSDDDHTQYAKTDGSRNITGNQVFEGDIKVNDSAVFDAEYDNGNSSTADTIDWGNGNKQKSTLTDNCTYTFTAPDGVGNFLLKVVQDATGSRTLTFPSTVKWVGGTAPVLSTDANAVDILTFYYDGTNYWGVGSLGFA